MSRESTAVPVDKSRCAQEPIHIPGSIQPHGVLLVLSHDDLRVTHVSENITALFGISPERALGGNLAMLLGSEQAQQLEGAIQRGDPVAVINPMRFLLNAGGATVDFECVVHRSGDAFIAEFEPFVPALTPNKHDVFAHVRTPIAHMEAARDVTELARRAADDARAISGFDRTMIYRFDEDWNGEVIAESTSPAVTVTYFGLRFPAGDIPEQARLLYLRNALRLVVDTHYTPAQIIPGDGPPIDLSRSVLRSVSPVHLEYLHNIGAHATLTISIVVGGRLWGLIACHHLAPRRVDYVTRASCEFFGQMLAWQLGTRSETQGFRNTLWATALIATIDKNLAGGTTLGRGLVAGSAEFLELFGAEGLVVCCDGSFERLGLTPSDDATIVRMVSTLAGVATAGCAANHRIAELLPGFIEPYSNAGGALLITLSENGDEYLLLIREEVVESVNWGGDVREAVTDVGGALHPRASFALWKEIVRGRSLRWSQHDIANAHTLREHILERSRAIDRRTAEERIRYLAHHDPLTTLPNRLAFHETLQQLIDDSENCGAPLAVLFVDLDRFKVFNDTFGHGTGDRILQAAALRMSGCVRHDDIVTRLGGDEFVIICSHLTSDADAETVARKIVAAISEPLILIENEVIQFTASVGIAVYPRDAHNADALLQNADSAMYRAKQKGRNNFYRYDVADAALTYARLTLERRIEQGLDNDEFVPFYQPIVSSHDGRIVALEALARWRHPERGLLPPAEFIAVAEESRSIVRLGGAMLRTACQDVARWRRRPDLEHLKVTVNVSSRQFREHDFLDTIRAALADAQLEPTGLQLELTESILIGDEAYAIRTLRALADGGIEIAIDDFGTGYSSLSYLTRLPVHVLKIDQSFVRNLAPRSDGATLVRAIIAMAHSLNLRVVAEGVETHEQLDFLVAEGCDKIQGYLIAKPLSHADATEFMENFDEKLVSRNHFPVEL